MPRGAFLLGLGLLLVAVAFVVTHHLLGPWPGVTDANVKRIKPGMTRGEVETLLDGPGTSVWSRRPPGRADLLEWTGPDGVAQVQFDIEGRAVSAGWGTWGQPPRPRNRLRLPFGR